MRLSKRLFGVLLIGIATLMLMDLMGYSMPVKGWDLVLLVLAVYLMLDGIAHRRIRFGKLIIALTLAVIVFKEYLNLATADNWSIFWVGVLFALGVSVLTDGFRYRRSYRTFRFSTDEHAKTERFRREDDEMIDVVGSDEEENDSGRFYYDITFNNAVKYVYAQHLTSGHAEATFGELSIYLDQAGLAKQGAVIKCDSTFGQINLYIPKDWRVQNDLSATFGSVTEKGHAKGDSGPLLLLKGDATFGGIRLYYI